jgi:hypothetical protein
LDVEPVAEAVGPGADRQDGLARAEAVATGRVDLEFGRDSQFFPRNIKTDGVVEGRDGFVVVGVQEKEWGRVRGRGDVIRRARIDGSREIGATSS